MTSIIISFSQFLCIQNSELSDSLYRWWFQLRFLRRLQSDVGWVIAFEGLIGAGEAPSMVARLHGQQPGSSSPSPWGCFRILMSWKLASHGISNSSGQGRICNAFMTLEVTQLYFHHILFVTQVNLNAMGQMNSEGHEDQKAKVRADYLGDQIPYSTSKFYLPFLLQSALFCKLIE